MFRRQPLSRKVTVALLVALSFVCCSISCKRNAAEYGSVEVFDLSSAFLDKHMRIPVNLPSDYLLGGQYAILYFIPYGGGGAGLVTQMTNSDAATVGVLRERISEPLIIVGVPHDGSFLLDSTPPHEAIMSTSGIRLSTGLYESYFLGEVIPQVERRYDLHPTAASRYIGGYSLGGYAALRIGLTHPELFSRIGAHSPTLFVDSLPDKIAAQFMYPTEKLRAQRDPLLLPLEKEALARTRVYIDTGAFDINRQACELMHRRLTDAGVVSELHILNGSHGLAYWQTHMPEYVEFYTSASVSMP